ncbi:hypothetical protein NOK12_16480 [Nocardioides sp. OK12]|nr:hypothetical protein NOK12_16480 [Nocardioides sp. OK12]
MPPGGPDARGAWCEGAGKIAEDLVGDPRHVSRLRLARSLGVSERTLLGWVPEERHEHYDPEGNLTGYTVVVREAEWDDLERDKMLGLDEYEAGICACGFHQSLADDRENFFTFETRTCSVCKGQAQFSRQQHDADQRATPEDASPASPRPGDGRHTYTRRMSPSEVEERRSRRRPSGRG